VSGEQLRLRDVALDRLEATRAFLISIATLHAREIAQVTGSVTSSEVWSALASDPRVQTDLRKCDPRWLGAIFRAGKGWRRIGWEPTGSHGRPVARWALETECRP
jgi:hypothetical protein